MPRFIVGAAVRRSDLPAMAAWQPTDHLQVNTEPLWELACRRWRHASRPISCRCTPNPVGAGLPAMAA